MKRNKYLNNSWVDSRLELRSSSIHGSGIFTRAPIKKGEVVTIWGGRVFTKAEILAGKVLRNCFAQIGEDLYIGTRYDESASLDDFINHSCDPNTWLKDEVTLVVRYDISKDEEITIDYATFSDDLPNDYTYWDFKCHCGFSLCRDMITREDWKLEILHKKYKEHFSPYLRAKITRNL